MTLVSNNIEINKCKLVMNTLITCVQDKSLSIEKRNQYYSEYLQLAKNLLILSRNN
jgi:hypothetical protein